MTGTTNMITHTSFAQYFKSDSLTTVEVIEVFCRRTGCPSCPWGPCVVEEKNVLDYARHYSFIFVIQVTCFRYALLN